MIRIPFISVLFRQLYVLSENINEYQIAAFFVLYLIIHLYIEKLNTNLVSIISARTDLSIVHARVQTFEVCLHITTDHTQEFLRQRDPPSDLPYKAWICGLGYLFTY